MATDLPPEKLRRIKSLAKFTDAELGEFLKFVDVTPCSRGTTLFVEGNPGDSMFLIVEGQLRVYSTKAGGERVTLRMLQSGDAFGDLALFHNMNRTASVEAVTDSVLIQLSQAALQNLNAQQSGIASKFLFALASSLSPVYATFQ
ncbi:MAG TPA: hypothetical protein DCM86_04510 [Verrucomicrobiales bacterium]|nr:hypothetical protein [Verrucomicrobiales bacterium]